MAGTPLATASDRAGFRSETDRAVKGAGLGKLGAPDGAPAGAGNTPVRSPPGARGQWLPTRRRLAQVRRKAAIASDDDANPARRRVNRRQRTWTNWPDVDVHLGLQPVRPYLRVYRVSQDFTDRRFALLAVVDQHQPEQRRADGSRSGRCARRRRPSARCRQTGWLIPSV